MICRFRGLVPFAILLISATLTGCQSGEELACSELPRIEFEAARVSAELHPYASRGKKTLGRKPASVVRPSEGAEAAWLSWAEGTLRDAHALREALEIDGKRRKALAKLHEGSLTLVNFHGFIAQKKHDRALKTLESFQSALARFRTELCPTTGTTQKKK